MNIKKILIIELIGILIASACFINTVFAKMSHDRAVAILQNFNYEEISDKTIKIVLQVQEQKRKEEEEKRRLEELKKQKEFAQSIMNACTEQASWMKHAKYDWESSPTIEKSKKRGTCVTYVACVLQRLGYLKSGELLWHNGSGYGTGKVQGATERMEVKYMNNVPIKSLKTEIKTGDIILVDDNKSGESGSGGHIMIATGEWDNDSPYIYDHASARQGKHTYEKNRKVLAIVRLKQ